MLKNQLIRYIKGQDMTTLKGLAIAMAILLAIGDIPLLNAAPLPDETEPPAASTAPAAPVAPGAMGTREPLIEVSVDTLEINETNSTTLGILWGQLIEQGPGQPPLFQNNQLNFLESVVPTLFDVGKLNRTAISGRLNALIQNGQARILANPTLMTKSGFEATFLVGGEIPTPTVGQGGVTGVEYKKYGVGLKILPIITPRKTIEAQINVSVSNIDNSVAIQLPGSVTPTPGLSTREAGSKVEVTDGETVVLAGIKQSKREKTVTRVPFLGSIPLLGLLFRNKTENVVQTSLVFFVTFRFVK